MEINIWTDGACPSNGKGKLGGIGVYSPDFLSVSIPYHSVRNGKPTNQTCELQAILEALKIIKTIEGNYFKIHSDSEYSINCITKWVNGWVKNGWLTKNKKPVKNKEIISEITELLTELRHSSKMVIILYCKGHTGLKDSNYFADKLANEALIK
jgi:ribonuclease HI